MDDQPNTNDEQPGWIHVTVTNADIKAHIINEVLKKILSDDELQKDSADPIRKILLKKKQDIILLENLEQNINNVKQIDFFIKSLDIGETLLEKYIYDKKLDVAFLHGLKRNIAPDEVTNFPDNTGYAAVSIGGGNGYAAISSEGSTANTDDKFHTINTLLEKYFNDTYFKPTETDAEREINNTMEDLQIIHELIHMSSNDKKQNITLLEDLTLDITNINKIDSLLMKSENDIILSKKMQRKLLNMKMTRFMYTDY
jgi:hypothetical protein